MGEHLLIELRTDRLLCPSDCQGEISCVFAFLTSPTFIINNIFSGWREPAEGELQIINGLRGAAWGEEDRVATSSTAGIFLLLLLDELFNSLRCSLVFWHSPQPRDYVMILQ